MTKAHDFHMGIVTGSSSRNKNMSVFQEIRYYFSKLTESLVTNVGLTELFKKRKGEIVVKFETKFEEQNNEISELKSRVAV